MDQPGKNNQSQKKANTVEPPSNLPGIDDNTNPVNNIQEPPQDTAQTNKSEDNINVPERTSLKNQFPESASKKISQNPGVNKFGEPEDLVPKGLPSNDDNQKEDKVTTAKEEIEKPKEEQIASDTTTDDIAGKDEYSGPSIEDLERKGMIKKVIVLAVVGILVIVTAIFAYSKWVKKPATNDDEQIEVVEEEPVLEEDIDEDGLPNEWEEKYGLDPKNANDVNQDPDFDRLTNKKEYEYGTDPKNADTDGDGYKDGAEVQDGYNPNGSGNLNNKNDQANYYPTIKGKWQGTMTGSFYGSEVFETTLQSNGGMAGNLIYTILNTEDRSLECELDGVFTYKKETSVFTSKLTSNAAYKEGKQVLTRGDFSLNLNGTLKSNNELSGSWVLEPITNIFWLKQDRGNFILRKIADF